MYRHLRDLVHDLRNSLIPLALSSDAAGVQQAITICHEISAVIDGGVGDENLEPMLLQDRFEAFEAERPSLEATYDVSITLTHDVLLGATVWSDPATARRVARNLISNAAKAGAKNIKIHYLENPKTIEIVFADDGKGMGPCGLCPKTALQSGQGSKGTWIVEDLIHQAGGHVSWESRLGIGTWVTILMRKAGPTQTVRNTDDTDTQTWVGPK